MSENGRLVLLGAPLGNSADASSRLRDILARADVVAAEDGSVEVYTSFADFHAVNEALASAGFKGDEAEVAMIPSIAAPIADVETAQKVLKLIDMLEDLDDVQNVYHNAEIPDEIMEQLG